MRVLFLQKVDNAKGGVINVNLHLMQMMCDCGNEVHLLSIRHGYTWEEIIYPEQVKQHLANRDEIWGCPRLSEIADFLKHGHPVNAAKHGLDRIHYKIQISRDYRQSENQIRQINPDVIICSHYEILKGIPDEYLSRSVMHFHTSFDQILKNRSYRNIFHKYKDRIYSFIWLSQKTAEQATAFGYTNSTYIYNPISFSSETAADQNNKKVIFLGRLSPEKRVHLAIRYFREAIEENNIADWTFEIYGDGDLESEIRAEIGNHPNIHYMGRTENVKETLLTGSFMVLTSQFEGMPLSVLEANECGLPVLAFDFGESADEIIKNGVTGLIIPQGNEKQYKQELSKMMLDQDYRQRLSDHAKEFVKTFSAEEIGSQWENLLAEISAKQEKNS